jgi:pimeloyl-ACP methyl ester carboxylesterase
MRIIGLACGGSGHSYGGAVITIAATGDSQVKALVYVDGFAPGQGQTIGQLVSAHRGSYVLPPAKERAAMPAGPTRRAAGHGRAGPRPHDHGARRAAPVQ